jgi:hypothetical protein
MRDDDVMDQLLKDAMAAPPPKLSSDFDASVMRAVQPRRLTTSGRVVLAAYALFAIATMVLFMKDLRPEWIAAALVATVPIAAGTGAYVKQLLAN